ncbi:BI1-like protein [Hibiscus syriacus]|uniref:BI1-like protein n=1 Tax=Hibiscus syriacus TaxID=106335 RepID=A0A6A3B8V6_HIBSY|nr:BI1-like protein [Hibiscus syriacus]
MEEPPYHVLHKLPPRNRRSSQTCSGNLKPNLKWIIVCESLKASPRRLSSSPTAESPPHVLAAALIIRGFLLNASSSVSNLTVGVSCANTDGRIALEALILTAGVVASLTGYLNPHTVCIIVMRMFFPLGSTLTAVYGGISAFIFCGYIVFNTDNLIKRFTYDDYILASATLYLDILNLFISILLVLRSGEN